jgi:cytochrome c
MKHMTKVRISVATALVGVLALASFEFVVKPVVAQEAAQGDADAGSEIYNAVCKGCHGVSIAPTLRGVINRPIASVTTFLGYSSALKAKSAETWTPANLDAFIAAPNTFAPGAMMTTSVPDAQQRVDLISYLESLPPPRE